MTMPLSLRSLRKTLLAACLVAAAGVVPLTLQAAERLKIGTVVWAGYAPFYVADALDLYKKHNLKVIEDSCDALGATLRGTPTGTRADISVTSFALSHIITAAA